MKKFGFIFSLIGTLFLSASIYILQDTFEHIQNSQLINAKVVNVEWKSTGKSRMAYPTFQYSFKGKTFSEQSRFGSSPAPYKKGENVDLYVDPKNPTHFKDNSFLSLWGGALGCSIFALFFCAFGYSLMYFIIKRALKFKRLTQEGQIIWGKIIAINPNYKIKINRKPTYNILIAANCFSLQLTFKSDLITSKPLANVGDEMKILVSRSNPQFDYIVDHNQYRKITQKKAA